MGGFNAIPFLGGGIDIQGLVSSIIFAERAPARRLEAERASLQDKDKLYSDFNAKLSSLLSKVDSLKSTSFDVKKATSSNDKIFTATASGSAVPGLYRIKVSSLAQASTYSTNTFADETTALGVSGDITITQDGTSDTISLADTDTLNDLATKINNLGRNYTASIIKDSSGARVSIISKKTGASHNITITNNTTPAGNLTFTQTQSAANASITVNGILLAPESNTVSDAINGVTLNLISSDANNTYDLTITEDASAAKSAINDFVSAYNDVIKAINDQFTYDTANNKGKPLAGDATLRQVQGDLQAIVSGEFGGNTTYKTLRSIGLEMQNDGTLSVNDTTLTDALSKSYAQVQNLFKSTSPEGIGAKLSNKLKSVTDAVSGPIKVARDGIQSRITSIDDQIRLIDERLELRQKFLTERFARADAALRQLSALQAQISAQLAALR